MNKDRALADIHKQMSDARSHLGRGLLECQRLHEAALTAWSWVDDGKPCCCAGCTVRKSIELALDDLEVEA